MPDLILSPVASKTCTRCGEVKPLTEFYKRKPGKNWLQPTCKTCNSIAMKAYREANKATLAARSKDYREKNRIDINKKSKDIYIDQKEKILAASKEWRLQNRDKWLKSNRDYYQKNVAEILVKKKAYASVPIVRIMINQARRDRRLASPIEGLKNSVSVRIRTCLSRNGYTKRSHTHEILGCDWEFFKSHIERQFLKGMAWEKMGSEIHIDHITPISTAKTEEDVIALNHFTNLRPMWAKDNLSKGAQITHLI